MKEKLSNHNYLKNMEQEDIAKNPAVGNNYGIELKYMYVTRLHTIQTA